MDLVYAAVMTVWGVAIGGAVVIAVLFGMLVLFTKMID